MSSPKGAELGKFSRKLVELSVALPSVASARTRATARVAPKHSEAPRQILNLGPIYNPMG